MLESETSQPIRTPKHLWAVGILGLLWSAMGALDYVMTQTKNASYMSGFTPEQLTFFYSIPAWAVASWAIATWGGVIGAILLLLRKRAAVWSFLASIIAMFITAFQNYGLSNGMQVMGDPFSLTFTALIFLFALALCWYSNSMLKRGVLR